TGVGDPHVNTIDNGRYTCHVHGLFVFAQTNTEASQVAQNNLNSNASNIDLIYPDDLFQIHARSVYAPPALSYIERTHGYGSIFSSYTIITLRFTFIISNNNGKFGFSVNNDATLTNDLSNNLNYDYINTMNYTERYIYRVQQTTRSVLNVTIPQLTISLWSGFSMQFEIIGENLECRLILPDKFRTHIEGLVGNFNGDPNDDLCNRQTNQIIPITNLSNLTVLENDQAILNACLSWKVPNDATLNNQEPIMPRTLVEWYYKNASNLLTSLNPRLNPNIVNQTCHGQFECIHDYIIRINRFTGEATALGLERIQESRIVLAEISPTIDLTLPVRIELSINNTNRNYPFKINIIPGDRTPIRRAFVTIYPFNTTQNINNTGLSSIIVPMPRNATSSVEVLLTIQYGSNSTLEQYLDILACLCTSGSDKCNFEETTTISAHYQLASCDCRPQYDGILCELDYDGCISGSACNVNWNNETTCVSLNATQQLAESRSYYCVGRCVDGYISVNNFTCDDFDECSPNSSLCEDGRCINLIGSYTCDCTPGYRLDHQKCIDIDECTEPDINGTFLRRCNNGEVCINTYGDYRCECSPIFNTTGTCIYDSTLCNFTDNNTCIDSNGTVLCINNTVKINGICISILDWCELTCPGFCEPINNSYQCNCMKYSGFEYSDIIMGCRQCGDRNYGYGCNESCQCIHGTCNQNATNVNGSCSCDSIHQGQFCDKLIDQCANNNSCNNVTEDCTTDPNYGTAICTCKHGYEKNNATRNCIDIDECASKVDNCNSERSNCNNTMGSYDCNCKGGYQYINGSCVDINECMNLTICANYNNTYCTNIEGSYECRCNYGYSVDGDKTQTYVDILNTNYSCIPTNYSSDCENQCLSPALCSATTGRCTCPLSILFSLILSSDVTNQTCQCPGHPFVNYTGAKLPTWFLLYLSVKQMKRLDSIESHLEIEILEILSNINNTYNTTHIQINNTSRHNELPKGDRELLVGLNISLNATQRLQLNNEIHKDMFLNANYTLTVQMIINDVTGKIENFTEAQPLCKECELLGHGGCDTTSDTCICYTNFEGEFCRIEVTTSTTSQTPSSPTNWTIIVAVISAIAGLLLIISLSMCIYIIKKRADSKAKKTKQLTESKQLTIPRTHLPTIGTMSQGTIGSTDSSRAENEKQTKDASDTHSSTSTTTYNPIYRTIEDPQHTSLPSGPIPQTQVVGMADTLNSFLRDLRNDSFETNDFGEIEFVTDMLDDMIKDDDNIEEDFIEAINPNVVIPRSNV
ncbi:unnamed protein product, partial [Rotaria sordida]